MKNLVTADTVAIVGLGYVGLPLAAAFGRRQRTIGYDRNADKIAAITRGEDPSGEVDAELLAAATYLELTTEPERLAEAEVVIVVVPTPVDPARRPDLEPLRAASHTVGEHLSPGATVVFESTVYPGCTEEVCVPIIEAASGLRWYGRRPAAAVAASEPQPADGNAGEFSDRAAAESQATGESKDAVFYLGYSPERINPGDRDRRLETITKVVSGDGEKTLALLDRLYGGIVDAGIHRAPSIRVAEAAKVIENTQRDINIALMNELAMIFSRLEIDTLDVLEAAGTKWNFLPFRPGLVGGHCIGVDPYYLTFKAQSVGFHPQLVLGGRRINDGMGKFVAEQTVKQLAALGLPITGAPVTVLGLTFKENCPDLRNSRVPDIIRELGEYGCRVSVHDPLANAEEARAEYGIQLCAWDALPEAEVIVLAVPHRDYRERRAGEFLALLAPEGVLMDVKGLVDREDAAAAGLHLWRL